MKHVFGFSCVENHVLRRLSNICERYELLFFDCFASVDEIYESLRYKSFEFFDGIPRIQNVLKDKGMISIDLHNDDFDIFYNRIDSLNENQQLLMQIDGTKTKELFWARGLRDDHYVEVKKCNEEILLINDLPLKSIVVDLNEVKKLYNKNYLMITYKPFYTAKMFDIFLSDSKFKSFNKSYLNEDVIYSENFEITIRNTLLVLRVLRNRLNLFMKNINEQFCIDTEIESINKLISRVEYLKIKNQVIFEEKIRIVESVNAIEELMVKKVGMSYDNGKS